MDPDFLKQLQEAFIEEAHEQIQTIRSCLSELEKDGGNKTSAVESLLRTCHSLKGSARAVNLRSIEMTCQIVEARLVVYKSNVDTISGVFLDRMYEYADALQDVVQSLQSGEEPSNAALDRLAEALAHDQPSSGFESTSSSAATNSETVALTAETADAAPQPSAAQVVSLTVGESAISASGAAKTDAAAAKSESETKPTRLTNEIRLGTTKGKSAIITQRVDDSALPDGTPRQSAASADSSDQTGQFARLDENASGIHRTASMGVLGTTVRLKVNRVEDLVHGAEELVYAKLVSDQRYIDCGELQLILNQWVRRWQRLRPEVENEVQRRNLYGGDQLVSQIGSSNLQEFLDLHDSFVGRLSDRLNTLEKAVLADRRTVSTLIDTMLEQSRELTMIPFAVLQDLFVKMIRDLARDEGKQISLKIIGGAVEIDRNILDDLREPLLHLLRNCVDHGIEKPAVRLAAGKPAEATIEIQLSPPKSGKVEIVVRDDGGGIDPEKVKISAVEKGILSFDRAAELSYQEALALIFRSSFSTRGTVSELSGRGLGCAIVKDKLEQLGGSVEVSSRVGIETKFRLAVPVRRATVVGIAVTVGGRIFVIPTASIRAAVRASDQEIRVVEGKRAVIFHERLVPMVSLADVLHIESTVQIDEGTLLIVGSDDYPLALLVEDIHGEQEVAVKNLPAPLTQVRNVGGATLLKNGDLAVVVNMNDVLTSAVLVGSMVPVPQATSTRGDSKGKPSAQKRILVVEDSITSRVLLKNILESAGFQVSVASDGQDGWEKLLQDSNFDLIVSDVEMPRMTGFELTTRIRKESKTKDIPIIIVTSLASLEDRRKGVEVGANAYFVKSNFDKSNLLEMVKRLI
jgi:two-component system, chemotaxis family, sensor kinase CheA